jgi:hypothetical protein
VWGGRFSHTRSADRSPSARPCRPATVVDFPSRRARGRAHAMTEGKCGRFYPPADPLQAALRLAPLIIPMIDFIQSAPAIQSTPGSRRVLRLPEAERPVLPSALDGAAVSDILMAVQAMALLAGGQVPDNHGTVVGSRKADAAVRADQPTLCECERGHRLRQMGHAQAPAHHGRPQSARGNCLAERYSAGDQRICRRRPGGSLSAPPVDRAAWIDRSFQT